MARRCGQCGGARSARSPPVGGDRRQVARPPPPPRRVWLGGRMPSLTRAEATTRAALLTVDAMEVDLDLDRGAEVFGSRTTIRFTCREPGAVDLRRRAAARRCTRWRSTGGRSTRPPLVDGRLPLTGLRRRQRARGRRDDGLQPRRRGPAPLHRPRRRRGLRLRPPRSSTPRRRSSPASTSPTSRRRTPWRVTAPPDWTVLGNGGRHDGRPGPLGAGRRPPPLATYFVTVCAGPYVVRARRARRHPARPARPRARSSRT